MTDINSGCLIILSGPSCVGKSPLVKALAKFYPALLGTMKSFVLYNSRAPRTGEVDGVDYHFRTRAHIESLAAVNAFVALLTGETPSGVEQWEHDLVP